MFYERIVSKKAQKFPSLAPSALARHFLHLLAMRRAQKGLFATAFFRRHVRLDCTTAALPAFQEYLLANYTPGKELFSSLTPLALTMHFLTFLAGGNAQNTTIHEPVRLKGPSRIGTQICMQGPSMQVYQARRSNQDKILTNDILGQFIVNFSNMTSKKPIRQLFVLFS